VIRASLAPLATQKLVVYTYGRSALRAFGESSYSARSLAQGRPRRMRRYGTSISEVMLTPVRFRSPSSACRQLPRIRPRSTRLRNAQSGATANAGRFLLTCDRDARTILRRDQVIPVVVAGVELNLVYGSGETARFGGVVVAAVRAVVDTNVAGFVRRVRHRDRGLGAALSHLVPSTKRLIVPLLARPPPS